MTIPIPQLSDVAAFVVTLQDNPVGAAALVVLVTALVLGIHAVRR